MDISTLVGLAVSSGAATSVVAEAARRVPFIPFDPKTKAGMRLAVLAVTTIAGLGLAYLDGNLATFDYKTALEGIFLAAVAYGSAVTTHDHALAGK